MSYGTSTVCCVTCGLPITTPTCWWAGNLPIGPLCATCAPKLPPADDPGGIQDAHGHLVAEAVERATREYDKDMREPAECGHPLWAIRSVSVRNGGRFGEDVDADSCDMCALVDRAERAEQERERALGALRLLCDDVQFDGFGGIEVIDVIPPDADTDEAYDAGRVECVLRAYDRKTGD